MTALQRLLHEAQDLVRQCRALMPDPAPEETAAFAARLEEIDRELTTAGGTYLETAAWCRLASGLLRGEDVPESIHTLDDEDPADTARWRKWRVS